MTQDQVTFLSYIGGCTLFALLTLVTFILWRSKKTPLSLCFASFISSIWHLAIAMNHYGYTLEKSDLLILEISRHLAWITAILHALQIATQQQLPKKLYIIIGGCFATLLIAAAAARFAQLPIAEDTLTIIWACLILAIAGLISVEQLYKNTQNFRTTKVWCLAIGGIFSYDIYLFSYSLIFDHINVELWQARGAINGFAALLILVGTLAFPNNNQRSKLSLSRPVAFYTTSMIVAGAFLAVMAIGGYYIQLYGGSWGTLIKILILFITLTAIATFSLSYTLRSKLRVFISKHFFRHKYDYRLEWLRLINYLSRSPEAQDFHFRALTAVASIFKSPNGALWLEQAHNYAPVSTMNMTLPISATEEPLNSPFCTVLQEHEWVCSSNSPENNKLAALNETLPTWLKDIPNLWLVLPLLTEKKLIGFMVLTNPEHDTALTWEDLDLLKTVGRQVASYLERHQAADVIAESKQFDAFNKLTAFIMHDLKNLIAQQALVVENAAKHKDNPAFVEDAIQTIDNSVARMNTLLRKLQHDEPQEIRRIDIDKALIEAVKKCQGKKPSPSLRFEDKNISINADPDHLEMIFTHIIKNAQEATDPTGFVDVILRKENDNAIIVIEDNGEGMDEAFIRDNLFKPFVTTKSGKGMGIGVYQAKEFLASLNGSISVESSIGAGSIFTLTIPASHQ
jgi:putative PEP-CTERM system histidine kinase